MFATMIKSDSPTRPFSLAGFNLDFNGTVSQEQLEELSSGDFIDRGESLILVGYYGTGKTMIAHCAEANAKARGKTSENLWSPSSRMDAAEELLDHRFRMGSFLSDDGRIQYRPELLDADVLIVDEVERWLESNPVPLLGLLGVRAEKGKSNVLVFTSHGWLRALGLSMQTNHSYHAYHEAALHTVVSRENSMRWPRVLLIDRPSTVGQAFQAMGIDIDEPSLPVREQSPDERPYTGGLRQKSVCQTLFTGAKSYRGLHRCGVPIG